MGRKSATKKKQVEEEEEYEIDSIIDAMIGGVRGRPVSGVLGVIRVDILSNSN